jgi:cytochrome oxidase assembly protein ShyY1
MGFDPLALIELWVVLAFGMAWAVLEWQCRRLDRQREARQRRTQETTREAMPHAAQESHNSPESRHPPG